MTDRAGTLKLLDDLIAEHARTMRTLVIKGRDPVLPDHARATIRARRGYESGVIEGLRAARDLLVRWVEADPDNASLAGGRQ